MLHFKTLVSREAEELLTEAEKFHILAKAGDAAIDNPPAEGRLLLFEWNETIKIIVNSKNEILVMTIEQYEQGGLQSVPIQPD